MTQLEILKLAKKQLRREIFELEQENFKWENKFGRLNNYVSAMIKDKENKLDILYEMSCELRKEQL